MPIWRAVHLSVLSIFASFYPRAFLKKRRGYCNCLRPSVRPSVMLSPPKPLDEIQPNLVCVLHTWMGLATAIFFALPPGAMRRGQKVKYHLISITKSISKILYQTLCVFSQMKYTKHIRRNFYSVAWVMPQGWDFGGTQGFKKNVQTWSCGISNWRGWPAEQNASNIFILVSNWWPWGEVKSSNIINFGYHAILKIFIPKFVCVLTNKR